MRNPIKNNLIIALFSFLITAISLSAGAHSAAQTPINSASSDSNQSDTAAVSQRWPRDITNADGSITRISQPPERILSTSVTITGTLLAIDAPVIATASAVNGQLFAQWRHKAEAQQLEVLWPAGSVDLEAAYMVAPDLIIVSWAGADSARDQVEALKQIAPVVMLDYGGQTWQSLALELGEAIGIPQQAQQRIDEFDRYVANVRASIQPPEGLTNIISYNGPGTTNPIATPHGVHSQLLTALGFNIEAPDPAWHTGAYRLKDFVRTEYENITRLNAETTFLLKRNQQQLAPFLNDPVLANLPSVKNRQVYGLGENSFRIDYFSAREIVQGIAHHFQAPTQ